MQDKAKCIKVRYICIGPFTRVVKESIHVKNPGAEPVIFKVKTTAPKQYCVRPNAGRIEPNSEIEVQSKLSKEDGKIGQGRLIRVYQSFCSPSRTSSLRTSSAKISFSYKLLLLAQHSNRMISQAW